MFFPERLQIMVHEWLMHMDLIVQERIFGQVLFWEWQCFWHWDGARGGSYWGEAQRGERQRHQSGLDDPLWWSACMYRQISEGQISALLLPIEARHGALFYTFWIEQCDSVRKCRVSLFHTFFKSTHYSETSRVVFTLRKIFFVNHFDYFDFDCIP